MTRPSHEQQEELLPAHLVGIAAKGPAFREMSLGPKLTGLCLQGSGSRGKPWSAPMTRRCPTESWKSKVPRGQGVGGWGLGGGGVLFLTTQGAVVCFLF